MIDFESISYLDAEEIFAIGELAEHLYFIESGSVEMITPKAMYLPQQKKDNHLVKQLFCKAEFAQQVLALKVRCVAEEFPLLWPLNYY